MSYVTILVNFGQRRMAVGLGRGSSLYRREEGVFDGVAELNSLCRFVVQRAQHEVEQGPFFVVVRPHVLLYIRNTDVVHRQLLFSRKTAVVM